MGLSAGLPATPAVDIEGDVQAEFKGGPTPALVALPACGLLSCGWVVFYSTAAYR